MLDVSEGGKGKEDDGEVVEKGMGWDEQGKEEVGDEVDKNDRGLFL